MNVIHKTSSENIHSAIFKTSDYAEFFFNATPQEDDTPSSLLTRLADVVRATGAHLVSLNIFGGLASGANRDALLSDVFGDTMFPVTWVNEKSGNAAHIAGAQAWGVSGVQPFPLIFEGNVTGVYFDTSSFRYCRLGNIIPSDNTLAPPEQAAAVFRCMDAALRLCDMRFNNVMRTWFFNHHLLDWYEEFNAVRDAFFREQCVYQNVVPASTGIEGGNPAGAALVADALAVAPHSADANVRAVPSPLQCAALEYGSSFSRATEIGAPGLRRLYISGTASISEDGETQFDGDVAAQIKRTMEVADAILRSRDMELSDATRVTLYFKDAEDFPAFEAWRLAADAPPLPAIHVHNDVCRHNLLFEIELDAINTGA